jgi:histidinol-phosphate aminotransferase
MGEYKSFDEIRILLEQDVPVLIDEAYIEFTDSESIINEINNYPNLFITRTFSKGLGAAGCRVGMVFSNEENIELISKFRHMYEISGVSMKYCEFLLDNYDIVDNYIQSVKEEKKKLVSMLKGYDVIDSNCNWIHFNDKLDNVKTKNIFDKYKVLVKYCNIPHDDRKNWCRLTVAPFMSNFIFFKEIIDK